MSDWPKHPDGRNKKIGEMTLEQQREVGRRAAATLQAEADDPTSVFSRTLRAALLGPSVPDAVH